MSKVKKRNNLFIYALSLNTEKLEEKDLEIVKIFNERNEILKGSANLTEYFKDEFEMKIIEVKNIEEAMKYAF